MFGSKLNILEHHIHAKLAVVITETKGKVPTLAELMGLL